MASIPTLNLQTIELVSTLRVAPANGAPSSLDYNDSSQEELTDLSALASAVNDVLLPILNGLPPEASTGAEGTSIYSDTTAQDTLVYDPLSHTPLRITDSMRLLYGQLQTLQTVQLDINQQVSALQARLSSSNQNDIALSLQNITSIITQQQAQLTSLSTSVSTLQILAGVSLDARVETPSIEPSAIESVVITWTVPFSDNTYIVSYGIEDVSGFLQVTGFSYLANGAGIAVYVLNNDPNASHQGYVHAQARVSQLSSN
jgi:hypothetical protein